MPGILPMKMIKIGSTAQSRVAQACDRCRSKKIRCDGQRPSCTQCINVGFECKTSDKLSRRAFPRGYTESLEEKVRLLETEVRELKELLDEKDEKIDILSRIHSNSPPMPTSGRRSSVSTPNTSEKKEETPRDKEDSFTVNQSPTLIDHAFADSYFTGTSSGRSLIDAFKLKVQETGKPCASFNTDAFFSTAPNNHTDEASDPQPAAPPRLISDQLVNIFFQEWAALFPALHRPAFLTLYEQFVADPEGFQDANSIAQLYLVFGIAALSSDCCNQNDIASFEKRWQTALASIEMDNSLATLQCLILAQIYCLQRSDHTRLLKFKGLAIGLSHRLGLHQSQKRFALSALTSETRKKVFWTLYTVDCFSAAQLGLPKLVKEQDVHCEYPVDADDEYITEKGFIPTLPGEYTKVSSALALFRASRILAKVLDHNYPASDAHEISFRQMTALNDEIDSWSETLAPHLKLQFAHDKPSTNVTGNRSPILSLAYHYIKTLIYRPAVCASSLLGDRASSSIVAFAASCKAITQIVQLLEERKMSFSICLDKSEMLTLAGFGLLFQSLGLSADSKLNKDNYRLVCSIIGILERWSATGATEFKRVSCSLMSLPRPDGKTMMPTLSRHNSGTSLHSNSNRQSSTSSPSQRQSATPQSSTVNLSNGHAPFDNRRATVPNVPSGIGKHSNVSRSSVNSTNSEPHARSEPALSPPSRRVSVPPKPQSVHSNDSRATPNLDYLPFATAPNSGYNMVKPESEMSSDAWQRLLSSLDSGPTTIYDNIYGAHNPQDPTQSEPSPDDGGALSKVPSLTPSAIDQSQLSWSPDPWILDFDRLTAPSSMPAPQSVLSFSDESLTSGEEFSTVGSTGTGSGSETYRGILIPECDSDIDGRTYGLVGLDGNFGL